MQDFLLTESISNSIFSKFFGGKCTGEYSISIHVYLKLLANRCSYQVHIYIHTYVCHGKIKIHDKQLDSQSTGQALTYMAGSCAL